MRTRLLVVPIFALALAMPGLAKDKERRKNDGDWQSRSRSADWSRRTDTEWRRYSDNERRRTTDRDTRRFRGLDQNGDGVVSRHEWRGNDRSFSRLDRDRDGRITAGDRNGRYVEPYSGRNDRLRSLDRNQDGIISQREWNRR
jgi:hypothetical protein